MSTIIRFPGIGDPWPLLRQLCEVEALGLYLQEEAKRLKAGRGTVEQVAATIRKLQAVSERLEFLLILIQRNAED